MQQQGRRRKRLFSPPPLFYCTFKDLGFTEVFVVYRVICEAVQRKQNNIFNLIF